MEVFWPFQEASAGILGLETLIFDIFSALWAFAITGTSDLMNVRLLQFANAVRLRFNVTHLVAQAKPRPILDETGKSIGFLDSISVASGRLRVSGWIKGGAKITLTMQGSKAECIPSLFREDVASIMGISPQVGFDLTLLTTPAILQNDNPAGIIFELADLSLPKINPISIPLDGLSRKRRVLDLKLLARIPAVALPLIKWAITRDGYTKRKIISRLGLDRIPMGASQLLEASVFEPPKNDNRSTTRQRVTIVLPVFNAFSVLPEVVERVLSNTDMPFHLLMINDASTDDAVWPWLQSRVAAHAQSPERSVTLLSNEENLGFIGTVNRGLRIAQDENPPCPEGMSEGPIVLLNSDAFVPKNWATRLVAPMLAQDDVATTTPMSNDAEIFSIPKICARCDLLPNDVDAIDIVASGLNSLSSDIEVPTGVGFCMAIARDWLTQVGNLDTAFGRGYGEEVDWCQRARVKGARHLAVRNLFVEHRGGASFGIADKMAMITKNNGIVSGRYPEYNEDVQFFIHSDPMLTERLALGIAWADRQARAAGGILPVYLAHSLGGGADIYLKQHIAQNVDQLGGAVVIRIGGEARWQVELHTAEGLTLGGTHDVDVVRNLLRAPEQRHIVYSCGVGDPKPLELPEVLASLRKPGDRLTVLVHDFFMVSPSYTLTNSDGFFVTTPLADEKPHDPAHNFPLLDGTHISLPTWQNAWGTLLATADEITTFSQDSAARIAQVYPDAKARIVVTPHSLSFTPQPVKVPAARNGKKAKDHIGVLGGINRPKGAVVLQALSERIANKSLDAKLTLIGEIDPTVPLATSAVIHGAYTRETVSDLAEHYGITHWLIPSVWPETFSFTTHETLATGLPVLTFDLGAQAEAAARAANGHIMPFAQSDKGEDELVRQLIDNIIISMHSHAHHTGSKPS